MTIAPWHSNFSWRPIDDSHTQDPSARVGNSAQERNLSGTERFWNYAQLSLDGAFDVVSLFDLRPSSSLARARRERWREAWKALRLVEPLVACRVEGEREVLRYFPPDGEKGEKHGGDGGNGEEDVTTTTLAFADSTGRIDWCLSNKKFDRFGLVLFVEGEGGEVRSVAMTNGHALADAHAVVALFTKLARLVLHPEEGKRGKEERTAKLPPALAVALGKEPSPKGVLEMAQVARLPTTRGLRVLPRTNLASPSPIPTRWRLHHRFSPSTTSSILARCKANSSTLSAYLQACIYLSLLSSPTDEVQHSNKVEEEEEEEGEARFTVPAMLFSRKRDVLPAYSDGAFMAVTFCPTSLAVEPGEDVWKVAHKVKESWKRAKDFDPAAQETYVGAMVNMVEAKKREATTTLATVAIPTLSSLGALDAEAEERETWKDVEKYEIASRNNQPSLGVHAWSLHGQLNVAIAWCKGRFEEESVEWFWNRVLQRLEEGA